MGYNSVADNMGSIFSSQSCEIARRNSERIRTYSRSRSSTIIIDLGVNRKRICYFLL